MIYSNTYTHMVRPLNLTNEDKWSHKLIISLALFSPPCQASADIHI